MSELRQQAEEMLNRAKVRSTLPDPEVKAFASDVSELLEKMLASSDKSTPKKNADDDSDSE